jgi:enoyl-CoA hydratase/carnithine racemase
LRGEIPVDEALASGLVTELIEPHVFEDAVNERVQSIAQQVPAAVHAIKRLSMSLNGDYSHVYEQGDTFAAERLFLRGASR